MKDIQIETCLTAYTDGSGRTWILIFHDVLWFGLIMDHSLINPNQIRTTGVPVLDDPFDTSPEFGMQNPKTFLPFQTDGTAVYFNT